MITLVIRCLQRIVYQSTLASLEPSATAFSFQISSQSYNTYTKNPCVAVSAPFHNRVHVGILGKKNDLKIEES